MTFTSRTSFIWLKIFEIFNESLISIDSKLISIFKKTYSLTEFPIDAIFEKSIFSQKLSLQTKLELSPLSILSQIPIKSNIHLPFSQVKGQFGLLAFA